MGVGEREGRVFSSLVQGRYFGLSHGQGWSGNLKEIQPKAAGSSVLQMVTHKMLRSLLR
jgi:O-phospho-L-seryl-tRNASec:L-selenocysteinyl-tRNA synthase